jgi:hypothetical protein
MKQIVKNFNNLIQKTIFKVQNKTNNKFIISTFNKYLITFISLIFFYLFYLLIPVLYDKDWIQSNIERKILNEFKINISTSSDISYRILPAPHFLIKNSKILINGIKNKKSIADVKSLKVFLSQKNFFDKEKVKFKKLIIDNANFSLLRKELKMLNDSSNSFFSNKKIKIYNSNIFFKDNSEEIITIIKIDKGNLFFDEEKKLNLFDLKGNFFGIPFVFEIENKIDLIKNKKINFKTRSLKLSIVNEFITNNDNSNNGKNTILFLNSIIKTKYNMKEKLLTFASDNSKLSGLKIDYSGELSINPFDLNINIDLGNYEISELFSLNSIFKEFIKSELLFNENLSLDVSIFAKTNTLGDIFNSAEIYFNIINGKINFDNSKFVNRDIGFLKLIKSNLFLENDKLILNADLSIFIKNSDNLFSFLNTNKKSRREIKNILINLDYDFLNGQIKFNKIKIDNNKVSDQFLNILDDFNSNNNLIKSRRLLNRLFDIYEG